MNLLLRLLSKESSSSQIAGPIRIARLTMASLVVRIPDFGPAPPHHIPQLFWNIFFLEDSYWDEAVRPADLPANWMELSVGHHCRQTDALEEPDFVFELHNPNLSREGTLLQPNCIRTLAAGQFDVEAALRRHLAIPQTRDRRYDTKLIHYPNFLPIDKRHKIG